MDNLKLYDAVREVPKEALKEIKGGRLSGKSDINPMWRIKKLTEQFGMCGFGWKYEILDERLEPGAGGEIAAFVKINLYVCQEGKWSEPIPGTGGSSFVAKEKTGMYVSDECFKMALTDAISVACKALGFAADVYYSQDRTKYDVQQDAGKKQDSDIISSGQAQRLFAVAQGNNEAVREVLTKYKYKKSTDIKKKDYESIVKEVEAAVNK